MAGHFPVLVQMLQNAFNIVIIIIIVITIWIKLKQKIPQQICDKLIKIHFAIVHTVYKTERESSVS